MGRADFHGERRWTAAQPARRLARSGGGGGGGSGPVDGGAVVCPPRCTNANDRDNEIGSTMTAPGESIRVKSRRGLINPGFGLGVHNLQMQQGAAAPDEELLVGRQVGRLAERAAVLQSSVIQKIREARWISDVDGGRVDDGRSRIAQNRLARGDEFRGPDSRCQSRGYLTVTGECTERASTSTVWV